MSNEQKTVILDAVAAHFKRKAEFFEAEALQLAIAVRELSEDNRRLNALTEDKE